MHGVGHGEVDRLLQIQPVVDVAQEEQQLPLLLLVAAGRAECQVGLAVAQRQRGRERGARPLARRQRAGQPLFQPEHLRARVQPETQFGDDGRGLEPSAGQRGRDHVAPAVDDVDVRGVAPLGRSAHIGQRGLIGGAAGRGDLRQTLQRVHDTGHLRLEAGHAAGQEVLRRHFADQRAAFVVVGVGQQVLQRHVDEGRIAVIGLAVGKGQLHGFRDPVHEFRAGRAHAGQVHALEQRERLQEDRALAPRARLGHGVAVVVVGDRLVVAGGPARQVVRGDHAPVGGAALVHDVGAAREAFDLFGHEAPVERVARRLDLAFAVRARALGLLQHAGPGAGQRRIAEQLAGLRHLAARHVDLGRRRPVGFEKVLQAGDGIGNARHQRMAMLGVIDGGLQHVAHAHRAVVAQQQHPGVEGARDDRGQEPVARDQLQAFGAVTLQRGRGRRGALAAQDLDAAGARRIEHGGHFAGRPHQVGLDHLQHEGRRDAGVERIAAALQERHAGRASQPMGGGHDTEGAENFRTRCEHGSPPTRCAGPLKGATPTDRQSRIRDVPDVPRYVGTVARLHIRHA
ncbi:hypothetical protein D9M68_479550 [compost metagenome]